MVEHRSPKPSMGVRIPHPLERRSPADVMSAGLFVVCGFKMAKGQTSYIQKQVKSSSNIVNSL